MTWSDQTTLITATQLQSTRKTNILGIGSRYKCSVYKYILLFILLLIGPYLLWLTSLCNSISTKHEQTNANTHIRNSAPPSQSSFSQSLYCCQRDGKSMVLFWVPYLPLSVNLLHLLAFFDAFLTIRTDLSVSKNQVRDVFGCLKTPIKTCEAAFTRLATKVPRIVSLFALIAQPYYKLAMMWLHMDGWQHV